MSSNRFFSNRRCLDTFYRLNQYFIDFDKAKRRYDELPSLAKDDRFIPVTASAKAENEEAKRLDKLMTRLSVEVNESKLADQYIECIKDESNFGFKFGK